MDIKKALLFLACNMHLSFSYAASTTPWFTGPILAPAGHTVPANHVNFETYALSLDYNGLYTPSGRYTRGSARQEFIVNPIFSVGLTDKTDIQYRIPYIRNSFQHLHHQGFLDVAVVLGHQLLEQEKALWRPDVRLTVQEIVPNAKFDQLNPSLKGTDGLGLGSYQTAIALHFQHLLPVKQYYLRSRFSANYNYLTKVKLNGLSVYGGTIDTYGSIKPGNSQSVDTAFEFSFNQHWVGVIEGYFIHRQKTDFWGNTGYDDHGLPTKIGYDALNTISLAPALEYNFTANIGLIAGVWFTVAGKNSSAFVSEVIALNAYW